MWQLNDEPSVPLVLLIVINIKSLAVKLVALKDVVSLNINLVAVSKSKSIFAKLSIATFVVVASCVSSDKLDILAIHTPISISLSALAPDDSTCVITFVIVPEYGILLANLTILHISLCSVSL